MPCCLDNPCIKDDFVKKIDEIRMTMTCKHLARRCARLEGNDTLAPAYNEFGYNEQPAITSRFLCISLTAMLKGSVTITPILQAVSFASL